MAQVSPELFILLLYPPKFWDYRYILSFPTGFFFCKLKLKKKRERESLFFPCICVYTCTHVAYVHFPVRNCAHLYVENRLVSGAFLSCIFPQCFETGSALNLELSSNSGRLAGLWAPGIFLSLPSQLWDNNCSPLCLALCGFWGPNLGLFVCKANYWLSSLFSLQNLILSRFP